MKKYLICALSAVLFTISSHAANEMSAEPQKKAKKELKSEDFKDARLVTLKGDSVNLSDYVGKHKYVMVDFWASWCGPCMREVPNVKAAYEKYKSRGLEIVGISLDRDPKAWEKAVNEKGMNWVQTGGMGSDVSKSYGVQYIPYIVIFDKKGNIVAKNLHGEGLLNKLEELMPSKK